MNEVMMNGFNAADTEDNCEYYMRNYQLEQKDFVVTTESAGRAYEDCFTDDFIPPEITLRDEWEDIQELELGSSKDWQIDLAGWDDSVTTSTTSTEVADASESESSFEWRIETMKKKLQASMKRSQETRQRLSHEALEIDLSPKRQKRGSLRDAIKSVQESSQRLELYLY
jgi:hypothetical protein